MHNKDRRQVAKTHKKQLAGSYDFSPGETSSIPPKLRKQVELTSHHMYLSFHVSWVNAGMACGELSCVVVSSWWLENV